MGLQQILLIVIGVIIVGIAIAVGIALFQHHAYLANRQAVATELNYFASQTVTYWKTPQSQGGAGRNMDNVTDESLGQYLGFSYNEAKMVVMGFWGTTTPNGTFKLENIFSNEIMLKGLGYETQKGLHPYVELTLNIETGAIATSFGDLESLE